MCCPSVCNQLACTPAQRSPGSVKRGDSSAMAADPKRYLTTRGRRVGESITGLGSLHHNAGQLGHTRQPLQCLCWLERGAHHNLTGSGWPTHPGSSPPVRKAAGGETTCSRATRRLCRRGKVRASGPLQLITEPQSLADMHGHMQGGGSGTELPCRNAGGTRHLVTDWDRVEDSVHPRIHHGHPQIPTAPEHLVARSGIPLAVTRMHGHSSHS